MVGADEGRVKARLFLAATSKASLTLHVIIVANNADCTQRNTTKSQAEAEISERPDPLWQRKYEETAGSMNSLFRLCKKVGA